MAQEVIAAGGESHSNSSGSISYTIGEPVIETLSSVNNVLTQGFQQSDIIVTTLSEAKSLNFQITAFPNPTKVFIKLKIEKEHISGMSYLICDLTGKVILQKDIAEQETDISFEGLAPSNYVLKILENNTELKSFQIIKVK
jgi:hypothetical protein